MQLGFLRLNSPPDCLAYLPSPNVGKRISSSADDESGLYPDNPQVFWKKLDQRLCLSLRYVYFSFAASATQPFSSLRSMISNLSARHAKTSSSLVSMMPLMI